jgi:hypothetical protein
MFASLTGSMPSRVKRSSMSLSMGAMSPRGWALFTMPPGMPNIRFLLRGKMLGRVVSRVSRLSSSAAT